MLMEHCSCHALLWAAGPKAGKQDSQTSALTEGSACAHIKTHAHTHTHSILTVAVTHVHIPHAHSHSHTHIHTQRPTHTARSHTHMLTLDCGLWRKLHFSLSSAQHLGPLGSNTPYRWGHQGTEAVTGFIKMYLYGVRAPPHLSSAPHLTSSC